MTVDNELISHNCQCEKDTFTSQSENERNYKINEE